MNNYQVGIIVGLMYGIAFTSFIIQLFKSKDKWSAVWFTVILVLLLASFLDAFISGMLILKGS